MSDDTVIHSDGTVHKKSQVFGFDISSRTVLLDSIKIANDPQARRCAQVTICAYATDREDARELLEMLGLTTDGTP